MRRSEVSNQVLRRQGFISGLRRGSSSSRRPWWLLAGDWSLNSPARLYTRYNSAMVLWCNTLQYTDTKCYGATHGNTDTQCYGATHCNTDTQCYDATHGNTDTQCYDATHCNTLTHSVMVQHKAMANWQYTVRGGKGGENPLTLCLPNCGCD